MPRLRKVKRKTLFVYDKIGKRVESIEVWLEDHSAWRVATPGNKALREHFATGCDARLAAQTPRLIIVAQCRHLIRGLACHIIL